MISTTTDNLGKEWALDDEVIRLRVWGTDIVYPLPPGDHGALRIGLAPTCEIQVHDPSSLTSREHAYLERVNGRWEIADQSKNGLYLDEQKCDRFALAPGREIGLSRYVTLIAESVRTIALRDALARMVGWRACHAEMIDRTLRTLRMAATGRESLVLCGDPGLLPLAEELHRLTMTEHRPFVFCDPRRRTQVEDTESFTKCATDGLTAAAQAKNGTVCIDDRRRPSDLIAMLDELHRRGRTTQLMVLAKNSHKAEVYTKAPVVIPPLRTRRDEIERLVMEYEVEAVRRLGIDTLELTSAQRSWIAEQSSEALPDIQQATLRLIAIRREGSIRGAATLLGISHQTLSQWLDRRRFSSDIVTAA